MGSLANLQGKVTGKGRGPAERVELMNKCEASARKGEKQKEGREKKWEK